MSGYIVPIAIAGIIVHGVIRGVDVYDALVCGVKSGLKVCAGIFPAMLIMLVALSMLRASGAVELLCGFAAPIVAPLGIPPSCLPLALLRPFSGSGALSIGSGVIAECGPDSLAGRIAAVMLGSSETSFYTIGVYTAYLGIKNTAYAVPAALSADLAAFIMSGIAVRLLM